MSWCHGNIPKAQSPGGGHLITRVRNDDEADSAACGCAPTCSVVVRQRDEYGGEKYVFSMQPKVEAIQ